MLGGVFTLVAWLLHGSGVGGVGVAALAWLGGINILLAVFNVIPAAPLDGGRLLQAVLWAITKDKLKAAMWAARSGQVFGWALFVVGGYLVLALRDDSWLWFIILGWFLTSAATAENQQAVVQSRLRTVAVREIMTATRTPCRRWPRSPGSCTSCCRGCGTRPSRWWTTTGTRWAW